MKRFRSTNRKTRTRHVSPKGLSSSFLAVFFSFFFVFAQASDFAKVGIENQPDHVALPSGAHLLADHHKAHQLPINSLPTPTESESKDEREKNHESDDDENKLVPVLSLRERFNVTSCKSLLLQLQHSRENRKLLSLFVLHHSWKSFLS